MFSFHSSPHRPGRNSKFSHDAGHRIFQPISKAIEIAAKSANVTVDTAKAASKQPTGLLRGANTTCSAGGPRRAICGVRPHHESVSDSLAYLSRSHENSTRDVSVEYHCAADPARTHRHARPRGG